MKLLALAAAFAIPGFGISGVAAADPDPTPPPYVIQGPGGPTVGGLRTLPPICAAQPRACAGNWSPDTGSWVYPPGTG
jgi:hypothetical protein